MYNVLVKPLITEKTSKLSENYNKYTFVVDPRANKIQIKKAIEEMYNVDVSKVNTITMPRKAKSRFTKSGVLSGKTKKVKKAIVTLAEGEEIDFYADV